MDKPETGKPLVWLKGEVKTPPFSAEARIEAGYLLRLVQRGDITDATAFPADAVHWSSVP